MIRHPDIAHERVAGIVLLSTSARAVTSGAHLTRQGLDRVVGAFPTSAG